MNVDDKLLVLAAKAAGMPPPVDAHGVWSAWVGSPEGGHWWDPLNDDGDALRLANNLGLTIGQGWTSAYVDLCTGELLGLMPAGGCQHEVHWEEFGGDKHAACRKAIVLCAAQIGEYMP
ncbi:TPA: hypothetical protein ACPILO_005554 [Pseudomonas aeruginosa]